MENSLNATLAAVNDVAVIGLGPSGVSAVLELTARGFRPVAYEMGLIGGQVNMTAEINNYPGFVQGNAMALADRFASDIAASGIKVIHSMVKEVNRLPDGNFEVKTARAAAVYRAVIVASGTRYRPYAIPDPEHSVKGNGFSRCAICDGPLYKGKDVMVIGGGEAAFQEGLYLASICKSVTLINRRTVFRAATRDVEAFRSKPNARIIAPAVTVASYGDGQSLKRVTIKDPNDPGDRTLQTLNVDACFIYIGSDPSSSFVKIPEALLPNGCLDVDEDMKVVAVKGLLGCGDVTDTPLRQVATASGNGAIAGISASRYLASNRW